ncbi:hypothetical protein BL1202_00653 [Bacillus licheniformis]|uniref:hypothetical protein n=1 Tax=Bacillus licheniformis TaxID=1402 RepID=UPI00084A46E6|nr:hypothetical protein [Bacillus licheniformis]AOP13622.1 hypothetical protein BL1202_00653 [Bacillus licheniformis]MEC0478785.1 hypothetical protein [Bacillus licheniformis]
MDKTFPDTIKAMRTHLINGMHAAEKSYTTLKNSGLISKLKISDDRRITITLAHLNQANIFITAAQTVYQLETPGENQEIERFFHQFQVFNDELLDSISTDHSDQWTGIEFRELVKNYNELPEIFELKPFIVD